MQRTCELFGSTISHPELSDPLWSKHRSASLQPTIVCYLVSMFVYLSTCLSVCLFVCLSVCPLVSWKSTRSNSAEFSTIHHFILQGGNTLRCEPLATNQFTDIEGCNGYSRVLCFHIILAFQKLTSHARVRWELRHGKIAWGPKAIFLWFSSPS